MILYRSLTIAVLSLLSAHTNAVTAQDQYCSGTIAEVIKWSDHNHASVRLDGSNRYFSLPSNVEESIVLMAYAAGKDIKINWRVSSGVSVTDCIADWPNYKTLDGFLVIQ